MPHGFRFDDLPPASRRGRYTQRHVFRGVQLDPNDSGLNSQKAYSSRISARVESYASQSLPSYHSRRRLPRFLDFDDLVPTVVLVDIS